MLFELIHGAIDAGLGSDKTECIADILVSISSTNVRGKVIARLRKSLAQTYLRPSNHLTENATWNEVCALARITLALGFNPTTALDTQLFLPELFHVVTLLLGAGPVIMRQTVYGLLVSIIHSLASNATAGEMDADALAVLLRRLQEPEMMTSFGVIQGQGHLELSGLPRKDETDIHLLDRVEEVSKFLGEVLVAGAVSVGEYLLRQYQQSTRLISIRLRQCLASQMDGSGCGDVFPAQSRHAAPSLYRSRLSRI